VFELSRIDPGSELYVQQSHNNKRLRHISMVDRGCPIQKTIQQELWGITMLKRFPPDLCCSSRINPRHRNRLAACVLISYERSTYQLKHSGKVTAKALTGPPLDAPLPIPIPAPKPRTIRLLLDLGYFLLRGKYHRQFHQLHPYFRLFSLNNILDHPM